MAYLIYRFIWVFIIYIRYMKIKNIIVHHSAISRKDHKEQFDIIDRYHRSKGWGQIGYHFLIEPSGLVKVGRKGTGAHCRWHNRTSIGICLAGHFNLEMPTKEQEKSLEELLLKLVKKYNLKSTAIVPHRAFSYTQCYGKKLWDTWAKDLIDKDYDEKFAKKNMGRLFLAVEDKGQAYFVEKYSEEALYLGKLTKEQRKTFKEHAEGILNVDLNKLIK